MKELENLLDDLFIGNEEVKWFRLPKFITNAECCTYNYGSYGG